MVLEDVFIAFPLSKNEFNAPNRKYGTLCINKHQTKGGKE
jgi:hypothetical protein